MQIERLSTLYSRIVLKYARHVWQQRRSRDGNSYEVLLQLMLSNTGSWNVFSLCYIPNHIIVALSSTANDIPAIVASLLEAGVPVCGIAPYKVDVGGLDVPVARELDIIAVDMPEPPAELLELALLAISTMPPWIPKLGILLPEDDCAAFIKSAIEWPWAGLMIPTMPDRQWLS